MNFLQANNQRCDSSCASVASYCTTSNPCLNGGTCQLPSSSNREKRFGCKCPDGYVGDRCEIMQCQPGYTGKHCEHPIRSCRSYSTGTRTSRKYTVLDADMKPPKVYCDLDSNSTITWTLIQSYQLRNKLQFKQPLSADSPQNPDNPSWAQYRLSKRRMESIQQDSTKWRITCRYDTDGAVKTDYVRVSNAEVNIIKLNKRKCPNVEYIDIRGHHCRDCTASVMQRQGRKIPLHFNSFVSNRNCSFKLTGSNLCKIEKRDWREDNFGFYLCENTEHRCSSSNNATTQTWFGWK